MSRMIEIYVVSVAAMWVPAAIAVRIALRGNLVQQLFGGSLVAVVWPLAMPLLASTMLSKRYEVWSGQSVPVGALLPAAMRSNVTDTPSAPRPNARSSASTQASLAFPASR